MKIGIFDSGLGGLIIAHSLIANLPDYDYVYLGDTARVPYGNRSHDLIYQFTCEALEYLFKQDCELVVLACNTASAEGLRRIQQEYLPSKYPDRKVLGVLVPAVEEAVRLSSRIGVLATKGTVTSMAFEQEIKKLRPEAAVFQSASPLLVPLIENNQVVWADQVLDQYLEPLLSQNIDALILGCTHYPYLKKLIREKVGVGVRVVSQDEIIPNALEAYLDKHSDIVKKLSRNGTRTFLVTDLNIDGEAVAQNLFGKKIHMELVSISSHLRT